MKQMRRMVLFLLLNVLVSVCVTLSVLFAWDQMRGPFPSGLIPKAWASFSATPTIPGAPAATPQASAQPNAEPTEEFTIYQVQSGDTFESLAARYNLSIEELVMANGFSQEQPLGAGEVLRIPLHPKGSVVIESVIGVGDLETEHLLLKHRGEGELALVGWRIEDGKGNIFIFPQFPQLTLFGGGAVNVYTKAGSNTVVDLFWGLPQPIWASGMTVTIKDAQGNVRATYTIP